MALAVAPAGAQQPPIKIGLIMPYSGQFADTATQMDNAIKLYVKQHGDTVAGKKIEFIRKDTGGIAPDVAKRLAQELVVRDKVDILGGLRADAERAGGRRRLGRGEEVHGGDERRDLDHHHQVALHGAHLDHHAAAQRDARHLGARRAASRRPTPWSRTTARATMPKRLPCAASRKPAARSSARCASRSPTRISRPSSSAPRTSIRRRSSSSCRAARSRPRIGKALAERGIDPDEDQGARQGELTDDEALQEHGRCRARHHHGLPLRLRPRLRAEQEPS